MSQKNPATAAQEIDRTLAEWAAALAAGDLTTVVDLVTEDAEFWTHGAPPLVGRDAVAAAFRPFVEKYRLSQEFEIRERFLGADWCLLRGVETNVLLSREDGERTEVRQRAFSVLRLEPDGRWRFARGMTNRGADEPSG